MQGYPPCSAVSFSDMRFTVGVTDGSCAMGSPDQRAAVQRSISNMPIWSSRAMRSRRYLSRRRPDLFSGIVNAGMGTQDSVYQFVQRRRGQNDESLASLIGTRSLRQLIIMAQRRSWSLS
jgi:hypothetical protein